MPRMHEWFTNVIFGYAESALLNTWNNKEKMIKYSFGGPYYLKFTGNRTTTHYAIFGEDGFDFLGGIADGHLTMSSSVTKELGEIQKVLNGQKAKHVFGGSAALILTVTPTETEFENDLTDENYGKVPTMEVVKLLTDWRDFLISKGK